VKVGITCYPTYGGSGAVATELGIALAARGHDVHFITYEHPFRLPHFLPRVTFHEVNIGNYPLFEYPPYDLALAVRMHDVVLAQGLDLLHVHYAIPHATSAWIAKEMLATQGRKLPVVPRCDRVTSVSQWLKDETIKAFGCENTRIEVIPNFVDPVAFDRAKHGHALRDELGHGQPVLMHISNFRPVKRVRDVVRTFALVRAQRPCALVMVGDGPDRGAAEAAPRSGPSPTTCDSLGALTMSPRFSRRRTSISSPPKQRALGSAPSRPWPAVSRSLPRAWAASPMS
jgi:glycosyltransferase involved in cell wall biosynthesis